MLKAHSQIELQLKGTPPTGRQIPKVLHLGRKRRKEVLRWFVFSSRQTPVIIVRPLLKEFFIRSLVALVWGITAHHWQKSTLPHQIWVGLSHFPEWEAKLDQVNCKKPKSLVLMKLSSLLSFTRTTCGNQFKQRERERKVSRIACSSTRCWVESGRRPNAGTDGQTSSRSFQGELYAVQQTAVSPWRSRLTLPSWLLNTFTTFWTSNCGKVANAVFTQSRVTSCGVPTTPWQFYNYKNKIHTIFCL